MYEYETPNENYLVAWVQAREAARMHYPCGDSFIDDYRYCNVRREDDRVTRWIADNWRMRENTIPALLMARMFNNPSLLTYIGYPYEWNLEDTVDRVVHWRDTLKNRTFNPAYIVSTNGRKMDKVNYVLRHVVDPLFQRRPKYYECAELHDVWERLVTSVGVGSFMAAQVVADYKNCVWVNAPDHNDFVAPGPGSMRGLNRLRGLDAKATKYNQQDFKRYMPKVRAIIQAGTGIELCAQDAQNCLCEYDKYMRLVTGEGTPKQRYSR